MKNFEVYFTENDELTEQYVIMKGWRGIIVVKIGDDLYGINVITPERLFIDYNYSLERGTVLELDDNLILVKATDRNTIINRIIQLVDLDYFVHKEKVNLEQEYKFAFQEFQKLENWTKVY